ncbi:polysaccharide biosynthesis protein [Phascolarctobacterium sp.]|uniref:putative polysaccharide biosynthesis protein n=1 Tax=Phascolarctobacterium sp. TaxID=2049039 RepID=UPI002A841C8F|nr:polysaccharide biosynthesis protein [Phascolarctobacterium sp.]MDY5044363.1 polysaccharide biosynthesis protein [Phascolarctobacterium sp.]
MSAEQQNSNTNNSKFLKGTMILTISSIIVKVIGSLNWIILSRVLGGEGIGLYQMGFPIYLMAITVSSAGVPVAISIITSEKLANKDYRGAKRVFNVSLRLLLISGLIFSSALFFGADFLINQHIIRDSRAYYSIIALAPAVFFVTFLASFRGYLQGWQIMTPTATSEVVEQLVRVITMLVFADLFMPYGLAYAAGGASMGAGAGAFCALLVLMWFYRRLKRRLHAEIEAQDDSIPTESAGHIIKRLLKLALPVSLTSLMLPIGANLDLLIVPQRLEAAGFDVRHATELFGYLTGMAVPLVNLATIFTAAMTISLVPSISESRALERFDAIRDKIRLAFRVAMIITFPCFMGLFFLAEKVAALIYNAPGAAGAIQTMSVGILFLGMHQISTGILQGLGKTAIPVINMILACIVKVVMSWWLTAIPFLGIKGASMATVADFAVAAIINMGFIYKYTGFTFSLGSLLKPLLASGVMGAVIYAVLSLTEQLGMWCVLFAMVAAVPAYALALIAFGGLNKEDLDNVPFIGRRILAVGQRFGFFK